MAQRVVDLVGAGLLQILEVDSTSDASLSPSSIGGEELSDSDAPSEMWGGAAVGRSWSVGLRPPSSHAQQEEIEHLAFKGALRRVQEREDAAAAWEQELSRREAEVEVGEDWLGQAIHDHQERQRLLADREAQLDLREQWQLQEVWRQQQVAGQQQQLSNHLHQQQLALHFQQQQPLMLVGPAPMMPLAPMPYGPPPPQAPAPPPQAPAMPPQAPVMLPQGPPPGAVLIRVPAPDFPPQ
jgi:hypothetical protein